MRNSLIRAALLGACLALVPPLQAAPESPAAPIMYAPFSISGDRICTRQAGEEYWLDRAEGYMSEHVCRAGVWFDSFFIDERDIEENADRFIRVYNDFEYKDHAGPDWRFRINARIELPGLEKRLNLLISDEDEKDLTQTVDDTPFRASSQETAAGSSNSAQNLKDSHSLSLRWSMVSTPEQSFSARIKFRLNALLTPSLIGRYRYTHGLGEYSLARFTQTIFWKKDEGIGETSRLDLERLLRPEMLLRWSTAATFSEKSRGLDWGTSLSLMHSLSPKIALSYDASIEGVTVDYAHPTQYRLGVRYRQNFLRSWLFFEIEPAMTWVEDLEGVFHEDAAIIFRLEAHFGRKKG